LFGFRQPIPSNRGQYRASYRAAPGSGRTIVPSSGRLSWYSSGIGLLLVARLAAIEQLFGKRSLAAWKDRGFAWLPDLRLNNCSVFTGQPPGKPVQEHLLQTRTIVLSPGGCNSKTGSE
tara:strand:+ start:166 stop:522 length:357 start_codon:yes stop_codon:yes gene_type:complete